MHLPGPSFMKHVSLATCGCVSILAWRQIEAQRLYQSLGFQQIEPYYELPENLKAWLVFFELRL